MPQPSEPAYPLTAYMGNPASKDDIADIIGTPSFSCHVCKSTVQAELERTRFYWYGQMGGYVLFGQCSGCCSVTFAVAGEEDFIDAANYRLDVELAEDFDPARLPGLSLRKLNAFVEAQVDHRAWRVDCRSCDQPVPVYPYDFVKAEEGGPDEAFIFGCACPGCGALVSRVLSSPDTIARRCESVPFTEGTVGVPIAADGSQPPG